MKTSKAIVAELQRIEEKHGILRPSDVVSEAAKPKSILHSCFEWDDGEAAHQYRLFQARQLIRVLVTVVPNKDGETEQRVWVNLRNDPEPEGYRQLVKVLSDKDMRASLLKQAHADMVHFQNKYSSLVELAGVFRAIRKAQAITKSGEE